MKRRAKSDPVTSETYAAVALRDRGLCFMTRIDSDHVCRDTWGTPHRSDDLARLTIEHVKKDLRMGRRGPSQPAFLLLLCAAANVGVPSKATREAEREYLRAHHPEAWT